MGHKMKTKCITIVAATALSLGTAVARADLEVSTSVRIHAAADFYAPLSPQGAWVEVGSYGRCWHPLGVSVSWRPYCDGRWVWTDCGWYWASDEPWAWACYHYGGWVYDSAYGWIWVPGIEWAPAWVYWRVGGGYVGWAPLAPQGVKIVVPAAQFVFVENVRLTEPVRPSAVVVNNTGIYNKTTVVQNLKRETRVIDGARPQTVVVNEGPGLSAVQKSTAQSIRQVPIQEAARHNPPPTGFVRRQNSGKESYAPTAPGVHPTKLAAPSPDLSEPHRPPEDHGNKGFKPPAPASEGEGKGHEHPEKGREKDEL
jgi:hypothetical protein